MNKIKKVMRESEEKLKELEVIANRYESECHSESVVDYEKAKELLRQSQTKLIEAIIEEVEELETEHGFADKDRLVKEIKTLLNSINH